MKRMKNRRGGKILFALGLLSVLVGCQQTEPTNESQKAGPVKKVSFTLYHQARAGAAREPFGDKEIAVFPVEGDKIQIGDDNRLGLGRTDSKGKATIEFRSPARYSEYVLLDHANGIYMMLRKPDGSALIFQCGDSQSACDLGELVFEIFEFSFRKSD